MSVEVLLGLRIPTEAPQKKKCQWQVKEKKSVINTLSFWKRKSQAATKYFGRLLNYGFHTCLPKL